MRVSNGIGATTNQRRKQMINRLSSKGIAAILAIVGVGVVGSYLMFSSKAATPYVSLEAESGTAISPASVISDATASASSAVKFTTATTTGGKPAATNTGVPAGTTLTVKTGNQTISTAGTVISGWDVHGKIIINANNVTVKNSIVRGPAAGGCSNGAAIEVNNTGAIIQDVEVLMEHPTACLDGVWTFGDGVTLTRMNIHGGVDGVKTGSNILIQDSYIHDMQWFASDPNQGGGETHNDGVQTFAGDSNVTLRHNNIDMSTPSNTNAAWQTSGLNIRVENNWLDGGGCTINVAAQSLGGATLTPVYINNNRFGRHRAYTGCVVLISNKTVVTEYNSNVWDDTGQPVPTWQQHD